MPFEKPISIEKALKDISARRYVLPAIQRDFVWNDDQICRLFDSLMRGYPIGSFLFWRVEPENCGEFAFYEFIREYHERDHSRCEPHDSKHESSGLTAILDGQQRLTSLYIGLRGSFADKLPRKHRTKPDAYPVRRLFLNITRDAAENELGVKYDFRFLTPERAKEKNPDGSVFFEVGKILSMNSGPEMHEHLVDLGLGTDKNAFRVLDRLHEVVRRDPLINYYLEEEQDLDKVLNIFIRVNSGGTELSYSDLLLSIATAKWSDLDARQTINGLVDELNKLGFAFDKDLVLKAGLYLIDAPNVQFKVTNFNAKNMAALEHSWKEIREYLLRTAKLLADFGLQVDTLVANSVAIPLAFFLFRRKATDAYLTASAFKTEREEVRRWVLRSLLKRGIWGSGLDTLLVALREVLRAHGETRFPAAELEQAMTAKGKSLRFEAEEVEDVLELSYGDKRTFVTLALLFPHVDLRNKFHLDHIFPRAEMRKDRLRKAGVAEDQIEEFQSRLDLLPNLQLLEGSGNIQKQDTLPAKWLASTFSDAKARANYCDLHDLGNVPATAKDFLTFFDEREERLATRLKALLA